MFGEGCLRHHRAEELLYIYMYIYIYFKKKVGFDKRCAAPMLCAMFLLVVMPALSVGFPSFAVSNSPTGMTQRGGGLSCFRCRTQSCSISCIHIWVWYMLCGKGVSSVFFPRGIWIDSFVSSSAVDWVEGPYVNYPSSVAR